MNLAERVLQYKEYEITKELITTIEVCGINTKSDNDLLKVYFLMQYYFYCNISCHP